MKHCVERGHHRKQRLGGADVRRGLFAANMLLAGLQRQTVGLIAARIDRDADNPAGHRALMLVAAGEKRSMRSAVAHRHAKALAGPDRNIGPHRARLFQQTKRQKIGRHHRNRLGLMQGCDLIAKVMHRAIGAGVLEQRTENGIWIKPLHRAHQNSDAQRLGTGLHHGDGLRVAVFIDKERLGLGFCHPLGHRHGFGGGGCLVQKAGVGHRQAGQIADHGLIIQQSLEPALRDFGLIGGIGGIPSRIFQDIALDRRRGHRAVIALPDQRGHHLVAARHLAHPRQKPVFRQRRPAKRRALPDACGHGFVDQRVKTGHANRLKHRRHFSRRRANVAAVGKIIGVIVDRGKGHAAFLLGIRDQPPKGSRQALNSRG